MVLSGWGMASMTETAALIVSEFASNVVRAAEGPGGSSVHDEEGRTPVLWLRLMADSAVLGIEVWDSLPPQSGIPVLRDADPAAESGRGLAIVDALSVDWGWEPVPARRIKRTWAVVAIS
jgi:anti-sigma regulatory factor (Ser/Thr protein kinase)